MVTDVGVDWTPLDVFTWVAYREWRLPHGSVESVQFPRAKWSRDWVHWPPGNLATTLGEIATGVLCVHLKGSDEELQADNDRAWARKVVERNGEDAVTLLHALKADVERFRQARTDFLNAKTAVHTAIRDGRLQVWACKRRNLVEADPNAEPDLLSPRVFTHEPREVDEAGWVQGPQHDKGPWWHEARFDPDQVLTLWPAKECISSSDNPVTHLPDTPWIAPWCAIAWRAFGTLQPPAHIMRHRSFDGGTSKLPYETKAQHAARQDDHTHFDAAERELMDLLASGRVKAEGQPPAEGTPGKPKPGSHMAISASTFRDGQLAFASDGTLIARLDTFARLFPPLDVRGTEASPEYPLWHDLLIDAAELREAWRVVQPETSREPAGIATGKATVAGENRLQAWLEAEMRASPHASPGKAEMQARADADKHVVSGAGFRRAWAAAVKATGAVAWSTAGAKKKSLRA